MLEKEAKYEHGLKKNDYDYDELISNIRDNNNASRTAGNQLIFFMKTFNYILKKKSYLSIDLNYLLFFSR